MDTTTVSSKYQVVIPKRVRDQLSIKPGQVVQVIACGDRIEFLPVRTAKELRGFLKAPDAIFVREEEDRL
jgi:AbrB family looped-hinge helix DNA binding protein